MSGRGDDESGDRAMGRDPFADDDDVLATTLFGGDSAPIRRSSNKSASSTGARPKRRSTRGSRTKRRKKSEQPDHYRVISISLYNEDIARLDEMVQDLKKQGHTKANRSALIRFALDQVDIDEMPRSY